MTKEVIQVPFDGLPARKLRELFDKGYSVSGVAIQRRNEDGTLSRGAATTGGAVMWWPDHGSTDALLKKIAELEAMLDAVGAGGVGESIRPTAQADTAQEPVAWRVRPFDYGIGYEGVDALTTRKEQCEIWARKGWKVEPLYTAPQPTENLHCKSTQKRLATLWGYVKQEPARQPLTKAQVLDLWEQTYVQRGTSGLEFARAVEAAHGITGGQQ